MPLDEGERLGLLTRASLGIVHAARIGQVVDLHALRGSGLKVAVDPMHGACGRMLETLVAGRSTRATTINAQPDPLFGGRHPEPLEQNLRELKDAVLGGNADAGFATDGDGDRIGAFDERGVFVSPLKIAPLIAWSLLKKGRRGTLGKTFANTILLDRIAKHYQQPFRVFPVGFKHLARELAAGTMLLGGEESGGIGVEGYVPERDGILISLLIMQAMREEGKPLSALVADLSSTFGDLSYRRRDIPCAPERGAALVASLKKRLPADVGGMRVTGYDDLDGLKLLFGEDGWLLFRASGTEPVLRIYSEVPADASLDAVMEHAVRLVDSI
jgi:phosphomannomutase